MAAAAKWSHYCSVEKYFLERERERGGRFSGERKQRCKRGAAGIRLASLFLFYIYCWGIGFVVGRLVGLSWLLTLHVLFCSFVLCAMARRTALQRIPASVSTLLSHPTPSDPTPFPPFSLSQYRNFAPSEQSDQIITFVELQEHNLQPATKAVLTLFCTPTLSRIYQQTKACPLGGVLGRLGWWRLHLNHPLAPAAESEVAGAVHRRLRRSSLARTPAPAGLLQDLAFEVEEVPAAALAHLLPPASPRRGRWHQAMHPRCPAPPGSLRPVEGAGG